MPRRSALVSTRSPRSSAMPTGRRSAGRLIAMAALAVITMRPVAVYAAGTIDTAIAARSLQPGEFIVFTSTISVTPSHVAVTLFGRRAVAFPLADGRWRALVGIDLEQKPGAY